MSKVNVEFKDGKFSFRVDADEDGDASVKGSVNISEAVQEIFSRGEAVEGEKFVKLKLELTKLLISIDTDRDGEKVLELEIDLGEAFSEAKGLFTKKD